MSTEFPRPGKKFFSTPAHCEARKKSFFCSLHIAWPEKKVFLLPAYCMTRKKSFFCSLHIAWSEKKVFLPPAHCMARKKVFLQTKLTDNPKKITFFAFGK